MTTASNTSPYVGPRPFRRGESGVFFGRDPEAREVVSLVIAHRVVLLHATSGSGKTSLVNAGVRPLLEGEGFDILPPGRILGLTEDAAIRATNAYTAGVVANWVHELPVLGSAEEELSLEAALRLVERPAAADGLTAPRVVVLDQFEELFTAYPAQWSQRGAFVEQIASALEKDPFLRIVLSIREDYLAQVEALGPLLPGGLRTRIRLERLQAEAALEAIRRPAELAGRRYAAGVAEQLVDDLLTLRVDTGEGTPIEIPGEFVEPVQLQVVCEGVWSGVPATAPEITAEHLRRLGDLDDVLGEFYASAVRATIDATGVDEHRLRTWIGSVFITSIGTRGTVYRAAAAAAGIAEEAVDALERARLIRAEWRAGTRWFELTHDRLIEPIRTSNAQFAEAYYFQSVSVTTTRQSADAVFEGVGITKAFALAGAVAAAERGAGIREWVNVAGISAGSIVAALLAVGYDADGLRRILANAKYPRFADYGPGGPWVGGLVHALSGLRGLAPGNYFKEWMNEQLAASPLARELGKTELTFGDVRRRDLPPRSELPDTTDAAYERSRYRLHVIASDITSGRMLILPEDLPEYEDEHGRRLEKDSFSLALAVRMSISYPYIYAPVVLHSAGRPHYLVDGGLLSNFPIWLFDSPKPQRPTWGFRVHSGTSFMEGRRYRKISRFGWPVSLGRAMFSAATEGWTREALERVETARTVTIPTHSISTTSFGLSRVEADHLYQWGDDAASAFFGDPQMSSYLNAFGTTVAAEGLSAVAHAHAD